MGVTRIPKEIVERIEKEYPVGCRVKLVALNDGYRYIEPGTLGTVVAVDDIGTIHVMWDNRSSLGIVYGVDSCERVNK